MPRKRDAVATRERLLRAAGDEFAKHGLAGARIDRIAIAAETNKRMIYVYFGSKDALFQAVIDAAIERLFEAVPFTVEDLPGYTGRLFDVLYAQPELLRLEAWWHLVADAPSPSMLDHFRLQISDVAAAQRAGVVSDRLEAGDIVAFIGAIATAWMSGAPGIRALLADDPAKRRAAAVAAMAAMTAP
jgi:AcrR family transcriptional regulator